jgi:uncharacterized damage-inducible protein DinB
MKRTLASLILACIFPALVLNLSLPLSAQTQPKEPPTLRSILLQELHTTHDQEDWFVPIDIAVEGLTAEQARWQPPAGGHSVAQFTSHLLFWNRRNLERLQGQGTGAYNGNNDDTFAKLDDKQWADTVAQLNQVMKDYEKLVETADPARLASIAPTIANVCTHNAYHIGQILYVRKLQGAWNPDKGVK